MLKACCMLNEVVLEFCIWDYDDISCDQITEMLGITPSRVYIKGQPMNRNFSARLAKKNGWRMGSTLEKYASFEEQLNNLLDILESKIQILKPICEKYYCEFSCAIFIRYNNDESTPWVHLNERYNKLIRELNIEFDIDLYCLPNEG